MIIGRLKEVKLLESIATTPKAAFVAVYGRRRVGKTHLVRHQYNQYKNYLEITGIKNGTLSEQLQNFTERYAALFYPNTRIEAPKSWREAFTLLTEKVKALPKSQKFILFLDELPWLTSKRSNLLPMLDYFWNTQWCKLPNFKLIVCGSAASWMLNRLIHAKGGLHNRLTHRILVQPFDLQTTQLYLRSRGIQYSQKQTLELYMMMGGIPYYLNEVRKSASITQNINHICFKKGGLLYSEFQNLYAALFDNTDIIMSIVELLAQHHYGLTLEQIAKRMKRKSGGSLKNRLDELEASGFIRGFLPIGTHRKYKRYRLLDEYSIFYLRWIMPVSSTGMADAQANYWQTLRKTPAWQSWAGFSYESICLKHLNKIVKALQIDDVAFIASSWYHYTKPSKQGRGAQIDLLFDREDDAITLCEIKHTSSKLIIDKPLAKQLLQKIQVFEEQTKTKKAIFLALITTHGIKPNVWSEDLISHVVELSDLF